MTIYEFKEQQKTLLDIFIDYYQGLLLGIKSEDPTTEKEWVEEYIKWISRVVH